jgi:hypothetical protein
MNRIEPPQWMEGMLKSLLQERHREAVTGDLHEEFCEEKLPQMGAVRARLWYLGQVLSFLPERLTLPLNLLCFFTLASGAWLGIMDLRLRHPGYAGRELIAGLIVGQATLTLAALHARGLGWLRMGALAGCAGIVWLALHALVNALRGADLEGYVLLISIGLLAQALLTVLILPGLDRQIASRA